MTLTGSVSVILRSSLSRVSTFTAMLLSLQLKVSGARGGTRTRTPLLASGPKPGASTNFATRACLNGKAGGQGKPGGPLKSGQPVILTAAAKQPVAERRDRPLK